MVNPNTPPVPYKLAKRIWEGEYIDMAELLPEALTQPPQAEGDKEKSTRRKQKIKSILPWTEAFLVYIGVVAKRDPARITDLLAYAGNIIHAARQYKGMPWQVYDTNFRQQAAATRSTAWAQINTSLWTMAFSSAQARVHCTVCLSVNHTTEECDGQEGNQVLTADTGRASSSSSVGTDICMKWNRDGCYFFKCKYRHVCMICESPKHKMGKCAKHCPDPYPTRKQPRGYGHKRGDSGTPH